jgi:SAM-dependent methyltransferase
VIDFSDPRYFQRQDENADTHFYDMPRLVIHVDEHASATLAKWLEENLPPEGDILDLMSAWRSHLPEPNSYRTVVGLGMNTVELNENPALTAAVIQDLNAHPALPFKDNAFDACVISFSLQYLTQPVAVMAEIARVLRPGAKLHVAYSNRLFPTKAVAIWQACSDAERAQLIAEYARQAGGLTDMRAERLVDPMSGYDPLYVVSAAKA